MLSRGGDGTDDDADADVDGGVGVAVVGVAAVFILQSFIILCFEARLPCLPKGLKGHRNLENKWLPDNMSDRA